MGIRYPDRVPPALAEVLGLPPHELHGIAMALREVGVEVPRRYEGEIGSALHFLIPIALEHPNDWRGGAIAELTRLRDGGALKSVAIQGWYAADFFSPSYDGAEKKGASGVRPSLTQRSDPPPSPNDTPAAHDRRRAACPASAEQHLHASETPHA